MSGRIISPSSIGSLPYWPPTVNRQPTPAPCRSFLHFSLNFHTYIRRCGAFVKSAQNCFSDKKKAYWQLLPGTPQHNANEIQLRADNIRRQDVFYQGYKLYEAICRVQESTGGKTC